MLKDFTEKNLRRQHFGDLRPSPFWLASISPQKSNCLCPLGQIPSFVWMYGHFGCACSGRKLGALPFKLFASA
jgi:hypothetical protein